MACFSFYQIYYIIDTTIFQPKLLLLITTVHYRSCKIISSFSFDYKIKHIINVLSWWWLLFSFLSTFFRFFLFNCLFLWYYLFYSEYPYEISQRQCFLFTVNIRIDKFIVNVIALLLVFLFSVIHIKNYLTFNLWI